MRCAVSACIAVAAVHEVAMYWRCVKLIMLLQQPGSKVSLQAGTCAVNTRHSIVVAAHMDSCGTVHQVQQLHGAWCESC